MHVPDFLAVTRDGVWLFDVRPGDRVGDDDRVCFAASAEAALSAGWRYSVVTGWRTGVAAIVDTLSSQRRELTDRFGLEKQLFDSGAVGVVCVRGAGRGHVAASGRTCSRAASVVAVHAQQLAPAQSHCCGENEQRVEPMFFRAAGEADRHDVAFAQGNLVSTSLFVIRTFGYC